MVCFQILSDLHLESPSAYSVFSIPPKSQQLALLGDIGNVRDQEFFPFIEKQLAHFQTVFFLLGNHEPYHSSWAEARKQVYDFSNDVALRAASDKLGKFVFLDRTRYDISEDITILGCTLHSHVTAEQEERVSFGLNDFYYIDGWTVEAHNLTHAEDLKWLNEQVTLISTSQPKRRILIFTHHSPIIHDSRAVDPAHVNSPIGSGFATNLQDEQCWKDGNVCLWAFGHTHFNFDFTIPCEAGKERRIISNQRGYYFKQAEAFDITKVIDV
ncbi:hypothetical protein LOZ12_004821 [Ophidiomyces ophidiicola]|uniref:Uncharacterized protein n=1 Tax=Ophidiomyces ophidiicola TaxID=1387563 RepID=A0ACB8UW74_9EURO|nr:hypothetical protein LOZ64_004265 [Ophidiomyces ophidiicola]KAI1945938.1 hypothetical protein LOZ62_003541 [Ophidiomyces ophidiicola]KAI1956006.1 hypothetical protein LOZ59_004388 [Ophidiomyces ophidiicola]KAI1971473.1 hypothetical protein LOZ56_003042 [Ophidiomyces ophidiicola]KAI2005646.1 hypothetical protein LOZ50_003584 [Ophidiomyces ophidiicola]